MKMTATLRTLAAFLALLVPSLALAGPSRAAQILAALHDPTGAEVLVVAHRGDHEHFPENSIQAIVGSARLGAHIVEIDLRKTSDGKYILMHDGTVDRTTTGTGKVSGLTLDELTSLRLKMKSGTVTDLFPPTLAQALEAARGRVMLNIDLKAGDIREIAEIARERGVLDHLLFKYRWEKTTTELRSWLAANPDVVFMPMAGSKEEIEAALAHGPKPACELFFATLSDGLGTHESMAWLTEEGVRPWANTLGSAKNSAGWADTKAATDPDAVWGVAIRQGISMIQTDLPGPCVAFLRSKGRVAIEPLGE